MVKRYIGLDSGLILLWFCDITGTYYGKLYIETIFSSFRNFTYVHRSLEDGVRIGLVRKGH